MSATRLLADLSEKYHHNTYTSGNMCGLAVFVRDFIAALALEAKELAMDATYGTNSTGMDLFTVLAAVDGTGVLLVYCSVETLASEDSTRRTIPEAVTHPLDQFLRSLKTSGFTPTFFRCDKDMIKIAAI
jgi:hypothetical protein